MSIKAIYEDNHLLIVEKPPNILSQGDSTGDASMVDEVKNYLKYKYNKPGNVYVGLIHRLDRPVGGLLTIAKTSKAAKRLSEQLSTKTLKRKYLAIVEGTIDKASTLENYLIDNNGFVNVTNKETKDAVFASLSLVPISTKNGNTLIEVELFTGRKHQIRVQLSANNHPILYDMRYGKGVKGKQIALWASQLSLEHPTTKQLLIFNSIPSTSSFDDFMDDIKEFYKGA
ncbi:MAG: RluA family pseudouridine synthase [Christensenellaceae bacterium]|nr:RluA family pseudouridine synthase [Christensenellaceae bacterium]